MSLNPLELLVEVDKRHDEIQTYMREKFEEYRANYREVWGNTPHEGNIDSFSYSDGFIWFEVSSKCGCCGPDSYSIPLDEFKSKRAIEGSKQLWDIEQNAKKLLDELRRRDAESKKLESELAEYERLKEKFEKGTE